MPAITVVYAVNQTVYHMDPEKGVHKGVVRTFDVAGGPLGDVITYNVQFTHAQAGSVDAEESTLFPDVDSALAAYKPTIVA